MGVRRGAVRGSLQMESQCALIERSCRSHTSGEVPKAPQDIALSLHDQSEKLECLQGFPDSILEQDILGPMRVTVEPAD